MKTKFKILIALLMCISAFFRLSAQEVKATMSMKSSGEITVSELLGDGAIRLSDKTMLVVSFRMSAYIPDCDPIELESNNNKLTPEMREEIKRLCRGSKIYFEYLKAINASGDTIPIPPLIFMLPDKMKPCPKKESKVYYEFIRSMPAKTDSLKK